MLKEYGLDPHDEKADWSAVLEKETFRLKRMSALNVWWMSRGSKSEKNYLVRDFS